MKPMPVLIMIGLLSLAGCAQDDGIPRSVTDKYAEMSQKYGSGLGGILDSCDKGGEDVYVVIGSGGFSGETFIYDSRGNLLQQYAWDDMVEPGETPPPFDSSQYECTTLNASNSFGS